MFSITRSLIFHSLLSIVFGVAFNSAAANEAAAPQESTPRVLDTVTVTGEQPGPGLWRVSKGDNELWILGVLTPLPKSMQWKSDEVTSLIARADEVINEPGVTVTVGVGFFSGLKLLPAAMGIKNNPDGFKLRDVLPAELYQRWQVQLGTYFQGRKVAEGQRPVFASQMLYDRALYKSRLSKERVTDEIVEKAAKRNKVRVTDPRGRIAVSDPGKVVKEFRKARIDDLECFEQTLTRVESDMDLIRQRANAWAVGDIQRLAELPYQDQSLACRAAMFGSEVVKAQGLHDALEKSRQDWLDAANAALESNRTTFASLQMHELLSADGLLAQLAASGYEIETP